MIFEIGLALLVLLIIYRKKIARLADLPLRHMELMCLCFAIQFAIVFFGGKQVVFFQKYSSVLYVISFLILLWVLYKNLHIKWMKLVFLGIFLNFLAITLNGGSMPVSPSALDQAGLVKYKAILATGLYPTHSLMSASVNVVSRVLGDFIPVIPPHPRPRVISIGDIIMTIGMIMVMFSQIKEGQEE